MPATLVLTARPRNLSQAAMATAMFAIVRDPNIEALLGVTLNNQVTATGTDAGGAFASLTINYNTGAPGGVFPTPATLQQALMTLWDAFYARALNTPIFSSIPVVS